MPRTGRGGARVGKPGTSYGNRTDLNAQPIRTAPGQAYGKATEQANAQAAMPIPQVAATPGAQVGTAAAPPPGFGGLYSPTMRVDEPVQAGLPIGPGEGAVTGPSPREILAAVMRLYPNDDVASALSRMR